MALRHLLRGGGIARDQTLFEEMPLHRIACECEGSQKMFACVLVLSTLKLKLAKRSKVERISGEALRIADRTNRFQSPLSARALANSDRPVERNNGRRTK